MKVCGILNIIVGAIGIVLGLNMYGNMGIACLVAAVAALISGIGLLIGGIKFKRAIG